MAWLSVRRWRDYQHYADRNPPWIKWHISTLDDLELNESCTETRLFWSLLLLVAAKKENVIPLDTAWLAQEVSLPKRAVSRAVKELVQAGFLLEFDSKRACISADKNARTAAIKSASPSRARARARSEAEAETKKEQVHKPSAVDLVPTRAPEAEPEWGAVDEEQPEDFTIPGNLLKEMSA